MVVMRALYTSLLACVTALALCACGAKSAQNARAPASSPQRAPSADTPLPAETNPPGDIPDSQAFVTYTSANGRVTVAYPEGWERTVHGVEVTFVHDFNGERLRVGAGTGIASAIRDIRSSRVQLAGRSATLLAFTSNSLPSKVTGKRVRLQNNTYIFKTPQGQMSLDLWAPLGADNVDQWKHIAETFKTH